MIPHFKIPDDLDVWQHKGIKEKLEGKQWSLSTTFWTWHEKVWNNLKQVLLMPIHSWLGRITWGRNRIKYCWQLHRFCFAVSLFLDKLILKSHFKSLMSLKYLWKIPDQWTLSYAMKSSYLFIFLTVKSKKKITWSRERELLLGGPV